MDLVDETIALWERGDFSWRDENCDFSLADYVIAMTGKDPAAAWRGHCFDKTTAESFITEAGGNTVLMERGLMSIGIAPEHHLDPVRGDIVAAKYADIEVAGLCLGTFIAFRRSTRGVLRTRRAEIMKVWRCSRD